MSYSKEIEQALERWRIANGKTAPEKIRAEINIEELLNTPPAIGVDIISSVKHRFNEEDQRLYIEKSTQVNVDPDALLKTAKKNAELMTALEHARELIAEEIFELIECAFCPVYEYSGSTIKQYIAEIKQKYLKGDPTE